MNNQIFSFFYNFTHQSLFLDKVIVFLAVYFPYLVVMLAGLFLLFHHEIFKAENPYRYFLQKKKEMSLVFLSGVFASILSYLLKFIFHTPRPFEALQGVQALFPESSYAFPSNHSAFFMALAVSLFFLHKKAGYVFMIFALLIGLARIIVGVHFPIDILGGFVLGTIVSCVVKYLYPKFAYFSKNV